MEIVVKAVKDLTEAERRQIHDMASREFAEDDEGYEWDYGRDWHVLLLEDGRVVSCVGIVERTCLVDGRPARLGGISDVITLPECRRRGLAAQGMAKAAEFMRDTLRVDFALLVCQPSMVDYYSRLGWQALETPLTIDQPGGKTTYRFSTMLLPCVTRPSVRAAIDLCGLPW